MKIAMIGQKRIPSREGGIEIVVEELATRMVELGHQVDCYTRDDDRNVKLPTEFKGIRLIRIPTPKSSTLNAFVYSVLATIRALFGHYDVIHFHAEGPSAMTWLAKFFHLPIVTTIHGLDWQRAKWGGFASAYLKLGEKNATVFSDDVIVLSRAMQLYFRETYDRETIYLRNGVSVLKHVDPDLITQKWGLTRESYILFLARIVPEKGLHYLIEAYRRIDTDKKLVIAGGLGETEYVHKIREMAAQDDRIILTDFVGGRVREELMGNCALYVLPSDVEGMPISLLEALSFGVRCLVSDISENEEASGIYANYFSKSNVDDLEKQLRNVLESKNDFNRAKQIEFVTQEYGWDQVVEETIHIYEIAKKQNMRFGFALRGQRIRRRRKQILLRIEELEQSRRRSEASIFNSLMQKLPLDNEDVQQFNRQSSEIEILREELRQLDDQYAKGYSFYVGDSKAENANIIKVPTSAELQGTDVLHAFHSSADSSAAENGTKDSAEGASGRGKEGSC